MEVLERSLDASWFASLSDPAAELALPWSWRASGWNWSWPAKGSSSNHHGIGAQGVPRGTPMVVAVTPQAVGDLRGTMVAHEHDCQLQAGAFLDAFTSLVPGCAITEVTTRFCLRVPIYMSPLLKYGNLNFSGPPFLKNFSEPPSLQAPKLMPAPPRASRIPVLVFPVRNWRFHVRTRYRFGGASRDARGQQAMEHLRAGHGIKRPGKSWLQYISMLDSNSII